LTLLSLLAIGIYSYVAPFWALPSEFLSGFSAAAGIGLINSIGNLGGFVGPYAIGVVSSWTGIYGSLAVAGIPLLFSATLLMFLPKRVRAKKFAQRN
jgi:MFS transporter, ACS family, tartrate transporter